MDVANYLSELLMQNGEVNVPGLGYFAQIKVDGYYDNAQSKFYPPTNKIEFDEQYHEDDVLLQYIADKKKISLASSKYFTAKYIDNLRQEAMIKEVPLADLGTLHFEEAKLIFKPAGILPANPAYYGFPPVSINKLGGTSFHEQLEKEMQPRPTYVPVPPLPAPEPSVPIGAPPVNQPAYTETQLPINTPPVDQPAYTEPEIFAPQPGYNPEPAPSHEEEFIFHGRGYEPVEEEEEKNHNWVWITITAVVVLAIIGVFALYQFKPALFNRFRGSKAPAPLVLKTHLRNDSTKIAPVKVDTATSPEKKVTVDTIAKPAVVNTPVVNTPASGIDSTKVRFEVIGTSAPTLPAAYKAVANYKSLGIDAHIVDAKPGKHKFKISLGTYTTHAEAVSAINALVKTGKVNPGIWPLQINPKK